MHFKKYLAIFVIFAIFAIQFTVQSSENDVSTSNGSNEKETNLIQEKSSSSSSEENVVTELPQVPKSYEETTIAISLKEKTTKKTNNFMSKMSSLGNSAKEKLYKAKDKFKNSIQETGEKVKELKERIKDKTVNSHGGNKAKKVITNVKSGLKSVASGIKGKFSKFF
ncbi:Hypothetical protein SRAE_X000200300 [Strongyloides ratti]|uniref:Uncharacterized protein n=1 Tax=Strongyloides ratti TaxID=34506 RepID=A0A090KRZ6_STRRB|nr:Hypothetical protein SRAE_X000200300 [Strongyloides ratti]CEF60265.1 Hypothetical protein SRAE_X000200300 [Strongyloides ratti]